MSHTVTGSRQKTRQLLKAWLILGRGMRDRSLHMASDLKVVLLDALNAEALWTEDELDRALLAEDAEVSPLISQPTQGAVMEPALPGTDPALHERMLSQSQSRDVPPTSAAQRRRNMRTMNTSYSVPQGLLEALEAGYISPNLPPPRGMIWRCMGQAWRLCHRGG